MLLTHNHELAVVVPRAHNQRSHMRGYSHTACTHSHPHPYVFTYAYAPARMNANVTCEQNAMYTQPYPIARVQLFTDETQEHKEPELDEVPVCACDSANRHWQYFPCRIPLYHVIDMLESRGDYVLRLLPPLHRACSM